MISRKRKAVRDIVKPPRKSPNVGDTTEIEGRDIVGRTVMLNFWEIPLNWREQIDSDVNEESKVYPEMPNKSEEIEERLEPATGNIWWRGTENELINRSKLETETSGGTPVIRTDIFPVKSAYTITGETLNGSTSKGTDDKTFNLNDTLFWVFETGSERLYWIYKW